MDGALALTLPFPVPTGLRAAEVPTSDPLVAPVVTGGQALPDPQGWAERIAQAVVEVIGGRRAPQQLLRWTDEPIYRWLVRLAAQGARRPLAPSRVRTVRTCKVEDWAFEATAVIDDGRRCRAMALRFEGLDGRWVCTVLQVV